MTMMFLAGVALVVAALWLYLIVNSYRERDRYDRVDEDGKDE